MKQSNVTIVPKLLKKAFIIGVIVMMLGQAVMTIVSMIQAQGSGASFDGMGLWYVIQSLAVPLVIWSGVHLSRRDRKLHLDSMFASLLLTTTAFMIASTLFSAFYYLLISIPMFTTDASLSSWLYIAFTTALPLIVVICGLVVIIQRLRRQKQW